MVSIETQKTVALLLEHQRALLEGMGCFKSKCERILKHNQQFHEIIFIVLSLIFSSERTKNGLYMPFCSGWLHASQAWGTVLEDWFFGTLENTLKKATTVKVLKVNDKSTVGEVKNILGGRMRKAYNKGVSDCNYAGILGKLGQRSHTLVKKMHISKAKALSKALEFIKRMQIGFPKEKQGQIMQQKRLSYANKSLKYHTINAE
ncbi:hypothetical protein EGR_00685 [Echinococcus granulosus]|uniref:Uncharacterized protein n=1 Tax=Echinococcus granulosus TaxID=6210 RepID=W6UU27_ECHGR|nr:hypothetical protein EGR_00685 [Echinococcus granulosus]EUB64141.1 hypothetical protein EGR_00685 [Echinococcus granulosus]